MIFDSYPVTRGARRALGFRLWAPLLALVMVGSSPALSVAEQVNPAVGVEDPLPVGPSSAQEVVGLLGELRVEEAGLALKNLAPGAPGNGYAAALYAFHRGDYETASRQLPPRGSGPVELEGRLSWLYDRLPATIGAVKGMVEEADGPFVYRYSPGPDALLPQYAKEALEGERRVLMSLFGDAPKQPIVVEFFPDESSFVAASGLPSEWVRTTGTVAISKWDRLLVLSPRTMSRGYAWKDTLAHEYVHLALARASRNRAPVWFHEGSAKLLESAWRDPVRRDFVGPWAESLLARALAEDKLVAFESMHPSMAALPSSELATLAFAQVAWAVDFVFDEVGDVGYRRVVSETARQGDLMRALGAVLGPSGRDFERSYRSHLAKQELKVRAEVAEIDLELDSGAADDSSDTGEALDPILVKHRPMQDHARIGDMLRTRGHLRAALLEYERAEALGPFHSPALANKTARALVGLGEDVRARAVLQKSVGLYPEFTPTVALLAEVYAGFGDLPSAIAMAERAVALTPFDPSIHRLLAKAYTEGGLPEKRDRELRALRILGVEADAIGVK